jgi:hypothetical protein
MTQFAILLTVAVALVVLGVVRLAKHQYLLGAALIAAGLLVGPGGISIFG